MGGASVDARVCLAHFLKDQTVVKDDHTATHVVAQLTTLKYMASKSSSIFFNLHFSSLFSAIFNHELEKIHGYRISKSTDAQKRDIMDTKFSKIMTALNSFDSLDRLRTGSSCTICNNLKKMRSAST